MSSVHIDTANLFLRPQGFAPGRADHYGLRLHNLTTTQRDALTGEGAAVAGFTPPSTFVTNVGNVAGLY